MAKRETIWLTSSDGRVVSGHPLAYDFRTGLGLVQPLGTLSMRPMPRGSVADMAAGDDVYVLGRGGRAHALEGELLARREFAGYWEYLIDDALFVTPLHPEWSGAALVDERGRLIGIGSLYVQEQVGDETVNGNMFVPIDLLAPIEDDLLNRGRSRQPPRPWLGLYAAENDGRLLVRGLVQGGPADVAGVKLGDAIVDVAGSRVGSLADFLRNVWSLGDAGTAIPLALGRGANAVSVVVQSGDRDEYLRKPSLQ